MTSVKNQVEAWAEEYLTGRRSRRAFLERVLLVGGSVPMALAILEKIGVQADAREISEATIQQDGVDDLAQWLSLRCSVCDKDLDQVRQLVAGRASFMCDECNSRWTPRCSFCDKEQNNVRKLIAGPTAFICDECVRVCNDIISEDDRFENATHIGDT